MTQPRARACVHTLSIQSTRTTYGARVRKWSASVFRSRLAATGFTLNPAANAFLLGAGPSIRDTALSPVWFVLPSSQRLARMRSIQASERSAVGAPSHSRRCSLCARLPGPQIAQTRWRDFSGKTYRKILQRKRSARGRFLSALQFGKLESGAPESFSATGLRVCAS